MTDLEGAACHASLAQAEQVVPHLFFAEQIGRAVVMRSQPAHRLARQGRLLAEWEASQAGREEMAFWEALASEAWDEPD